MYLICREAIANALRHPKATSVEVEIAYAANHLRVLIQDNGCGTSPEVVQRELEGHWGLAFQKRKQPGTLR